MRALVISAALVACPAIAHDWDAKPISDTDYGSPFEAWEGWRPVAPTREGDGLVFVGRIERTESAVSFETVLVYRKPRSFNGSKDTFYDQDHAHWLGDCASNRVRRTKEQFFSFGAVSPPPPIKTFPIGTDMYRSGLLEPQPQTLIAGAMGMACGYRYVSGEGVVPYAYAQDFFKENERSD